MSTDPQQPSGPVRQLRLVVEAEDFERAVAFYRDELGLEEQAAFEADGDARVVILDAGRATLELANPAQKRMIDDVEAGGHESAPIRVAFEVVDTRGATDRLGGARRGRTHPARAIATLLAPATPRT